MTCTVIMDERVYDLSRYSLGKEITGRLQAILMIYLNSNVSGLYKSYIVPFLISICQFRACPLQLRKIIDSRFHDYRRVVMI